MLMKLLQAAHARNQTGLVLLNDSQNRKGYLLVDHKILIVPFIEFNSNDDKLYVAQAGDWINFFLNEVEMNNSKVQAQGAKEVPIENIALADTLQKKTLKSYVDKETGYVLIETGIIVPPKDAIYQQYVLFGKNYNLIESRPLPYSSELGDIEDPKEISADVDVEKDRAYKALVTFRVDLGREGAFLKKELHSIIERENLSSPNCILQDETPWFKRNQLMFQGNPPKGRQLEKDWHKLANLDGHYYGILIETDWTASGRVSTISVIWSYRFGNIRLNDEDGAVFTEKNRNNKNEFGQLVAFEVLKDKTFGRYYAYKIKEVKTMKENLSVERHRKAEFLVHLDVIFPQKVQDNYRFYHPILGPITLPCDEIVKVIVSKWLPNEYTENKEHIKYILGRKVQLDLVCYRKNKEDPLDSRFNSPFVLIDIFLYKESDSQ